ncbi:MAG: 2-dehydro-3-deoxyphosphooctonate aldolase [Bacteroidia bacterium]|nr:2-dehydro-3-deoxyphosphooctonate aldolase [Bacteroidia bacterium]
MKQILPFFLVLSAIFAFSCKGGKEVAGKAKVKSYAMLDQSTFLISKPADQADYGYSQQNPIKVGGSEEHSGPASERYFLNALLGPQGQAVTYKRTGSCCEFKTEAGYEGKGLLDQYEVTWEGSKTPKLLFINMYDYGDLMIPSGFTAKKDH